MTDPTLKYGAPIQSFLDTSFFQELSRLKLDVLKLDSRGQPLFATLDTSYISKAGKSVPLFLNERSFKFDTLRAPSGVPVTGMIHNFNVFDKFKSLDKQQFMEQLAQERFEEGIQDINKSICFHIISFADLKRYRFYYWVCVPCFQKKSLSIQVLGKKPTESFAKYQSWFDEHLDQWVLLLDADEQPLDYSNAEAGKCKALAIRDTSRLKDVPSAMAKNFLTIYNHSNPQNAELDVYFIRPDDSSFALKLSLVSVERSNESGKSDKKERLNVSGWERNTQGKLGPRAVDLSSLIDPLKIADQSVDLNLKLMKWRIVPTIDLQKVKGTKVLLLGAGTLGCYVSRTLMAWGVRKVTFVDNSTVSYSNPVRQPLFEFSDVGKRKAPAAAEALKKVFPLMDVEGVELSVPMIGHPVTNEESEHEQYDRLCELFDEHDVIFLLMDSRETRWLPTVLGNVKNKIVINAALGFDSYLVMRHGNFLDDPNTRLGCYFCQDVFAPKDSLTDRTLDEMCTVTRPGVALMAASQAVELLVSLLQPKNDDEGNTNILGDIPHQIRGFLNNFSTLKLSTPAYTHCSACCPEIVSSCRELGWDFVKAALDDHTYIERLSGLTNVQQEAERVTGEWADEDDEIDDDEYLLN